MTIELKPNSLLAVSGGADSMYLLHQYKEVEGIHVAHVNYHIRPDSDEDQKLVEDYCKLSSIPCHVLSVIPEKDTGIEEWARDVRYAFFKDLISKYQLSKTITAHNANDQAETVLMRILRGTGINGLSAIHKDTDKLFRPMLGLDKKFIYSECDRLSIPYREDSTNTDTKYLRNWFRHEYVKESMIASLSNIASMVQDILPKLFEMATVEFSDSVIISTDKILIDKNIEPDDLLFLYLAKIMADKYTMTEKMFNNIFSKSNSLNKFTTNVFECEKRKKDWIIITFR